MNDPNTPAPSESASGGIGPISPAPQANADKPFVIQETLTNTIGTLGFVLSIVGVLTCGLLSPLGVILSFFGLFRTPNRMAKFGLAISLLGLVGGAIGLVGGGYALLMQAVGGGASGTAEREMQMIAREVVKYIETNDVAPGSLEQLSALSESDRTDPWKQLYEYEVGADGKSFTLRSDGPDGKSGTEDDVEYLGSGK